jgi:hypothetical protein
MITITLGRFARSPNASAAGINNVTQQTANSTVNRKTHARMRLQFLDDQMNSVSVAGSRPSLTLHQMPLHRTNGIQKKCQGFHLQQHQQLTESSNLVPEHFFIIVAIEIHAAITGARCTSVCTSPTAFHFTKPPPSPSCSPFTAAGF